MPTLFGEGVKKILEETEKNAPNTGKNTPAPHTRKGGISVSKDLLPDVAVGDIVKLKVVDVDEEKGEVHLEREEEAQETTPPPEMA